MDPGLDQKERRPSTCRFCGQPVGSLQVVRTIAGHELAQHGCCGAIGAVEEPAPEELSRIYDELFERGDYQQHRAEVEAVRAGRKVGGRYRRWLLHKAARQVAGKRLVEIGVGSGAFGVMAQSMGWNYSGFDISAVAVGFARQGGLQAKQLSASGPPDLPPASADLIVMWEVIEHLWDVRGYLAAVVTALAAGGALLLSTPNYLREAYQRGDTWATAMRPPVHLNFFTEQTLRVVLKRNGFQEVQLYKRRLFSPSPRDLIGVRRSMRLAFELDEPPTLHAMACGEDPNPRP